MSELDAIAFSAPDCAAATVDRYIQVQFPIRWRESCIRSGVRIGVRVEMHRSN
jgi:hypothetical protein